MLDRSQLHSKKVMDTWEKQFNGKYPPWSKFDERGVFILLLTLEGSVFEDLDSRLSEAETKLGITPPPLAW